MKIVDRIYTCQMPGQVFGLWELQCHLRIFCPHPEVQTVIITDMGWKMHRFIPYKVEVLANHILKEFHLDPVKLIWIEHYTSNFRRPTCAPFSQITFTWQDGLATYPRSTAIAPQTVQAFISEERLLA